MSPRPTWLDEGPRNVPTGDPAWKFLDRLEFWPLLHIAERWAKGPPLVQEVVPRVFVQTEMRNSIDPDKWGIGFLASTEGDFNPAVSMMLRDKTPQAILRDLHRPEQTFYKHFDPVEGTDRKAIVEGAVHEIYEAQRREAVGVVAPATRTLVEERASWRRFLAEPWKPLMPDDTPRIHRRQYLSW